MHGEDDRMEQFLKLGSRSVEASDTSSQCGMTVLKKVLFSGQETYISEEITITNEEIVSDKEMTVKKKWDDDEDHSADKVTVELLANGEPVRGKDIELSAANNWEYTFSDLDKTDEEGNKIVYYAREIAINGKTIEELVNEGTFSAPKVEVTTGSGEEEKTVELTKEVWVPVTERKDDGTYILKDGETYLIVTNDWKNSNRPAAVCAFPQNNSLFTNYIEF